MTRSNREGRELASLFSGVDWVTVLLYLLIASIGCLSILSSSYNPESSDIFSFSHFYIKQALWFGASIIIAIFILLTDTSSYHKYAYVLYGIGVILLVATLLFGREINGAKAWLDLGGFRLQSAELIKIFAALAMARIMSAYSFDINRFSDIGRVAVLLFIPLAIIVLQNDTGSGFVLGSFIFVLYREGLNQWLSLVIIAVAALSISSLLISPLVLLILALLLCVVSDMLINQRWKWNLIYLSTVTLLTLLLFFAVKVFTGSEISMFNSLLYTSLASLPVVIVYAYRERLSSTFILMFMYLISVVMLPTINYIFTSILQDYQRNRILSFLGVISDPLGADYNVNQSKIAIGSGGLLGKGFLEGTQIRYGFVPERHTDFIFCSIGEEWGFVGATVLLALFCALILRLMWMGERHEEAFGRIYCYSVASILLFHLIVNVGMTLGLFPVMGIPLPFVSYGGSSLVAFTVMLFIAIKLSTVNNK
ncbi:MAG: rod shape-determining protein RodA [Rikenellaceae bacterium]